MFLVNLQATKSKLDGIKLTEIFNNSNLCKLQNSNLLKTESYLKYENENQHLEHYQQLALSSSYEYKGNNTDYKVLTVKYQRPDGYTFGRVYPIKSLGLSSIRREVRHTIANDIYVDIDVSNAHPELIYQTCMYHNIKCNVLGEYIKNRKEKLEMIMTEYKVSRDVAKNLFIIVLYFGSFKTWLKNNDLSPSLKPNDFIEKLIQERTIYGEFIEKQNNEIYLEIQKNKSKKNILLYNEFASVVAIWCQEIEQRILETLYNYCNKKKYIKNKIAVLCFDGIMIEANNYKESILSEFTKVIKETFGYTLKFETKPLNQGYNKELEKKHVKTIVNDSDNESDNESDTNDDNELDNDSGIVNNQQQQNTNELKKQDKAFFNQLPTFGHRQCAEIYYNNNKNKYIYSSISGWYAYNKFNVLESTGKNYPNDILISISKTLENYLVPIRNRMKANSPTYKQDSNNITKLLMNVNKSGYLSDIILILKELYHIQDIDEKIDNNVNLFAFNNKVFDNNLLAIRDIKPDDYICKTTNYEYDISNKKIREDIKKIIGSIFENEEIEKYFLNAKALSLFGNTNENAYFQVGSGGNGKSLLSTLEEKALGEYIKTTENSFITSAFKQGSANSTLANSKGIRNLVVAEPSEEDELGRQASLNTPFIKLITGNDMITTRDLYQKNISFKPFFTPFIQCNTLPNIKKIDKGIMRRIRVIRFPLSFVENPIEPYERKINTQLKSKLSTIEYAREYILLLLDIITNRNGNNTIQIPNSVQEETNTYFTDNNPVKTYLDTYIKKVQGKNIKSTELKEHFDERMEDKLTSSAFIKGMVMNGIEMIMIKGYRYFKNLDYNFDD
jgi:P4 family phage/plasmid primase-like protien